MKMTVPKLISMLEELYRLADMNSRELVRDGREISAENRARAEGYASAYSFCLMQLRHIGEK